MCHYTTPLKSFSDRLSAAKIFVVADTITMQSKCHTQLYVISN